MSIQEHRPFIPLERRPWRENVPSDDEKAIARSSRGAARAALAGATSQEVDQLFPGATEDTESVYDPEQLPWQDRMEVLANDYGFLPTTREELNRAFGVIPFLDQKGKTAAHLNEILLHRRNAGESDPAGAVRSVVSSMGVYIEDSTQHIERLQTLADELHEVNPRLTLETVVLDSVAPLLDIVQFQDLRACVETGDPTVLEGKVQKDKSGHRELHTHYDPKYHDDLLTELKVGQLLERTVLEVRIDIQAALQSHTNRAAFWKARVEESRMHGAARPVANRILELI